MLPPDFWYMFFYLFWLYPMEKMVPCIHIVCLFIVVGVALGGILPEIVAKGGNRDQSD